MVISIIDIIIIIIIVISFLMSLLYRYDIMLRALGDAEEGGKVPYRHTL
jgi:hypothetical protein